jgi:hypothetical protein
LERLQAESMIDIVSLPAGENWRRLPDLAAKVFLHTTGSTLVLRSSPLELIETCGYTVKYRMTTWERDLNPKTAARVKPSLDSGDRFAASAGAVVRPLDTLHFERDMEAIRQFFNRSFSNHEGVLTFERMSFMPRPGS